MIIQVLMPTGAVAQLDVEPDVLVYDGQQYVSPDVASYVELYAAPVRALSLPFGVAVQQLLSSVVIRAKVLGVEDTPVTGTSPDLIHIQAPGDGTCICFVTCTGTELRFVQVKVEAQ